MPAGYKTANKLLEVPLSMSHVREPFPLTDTEDPVFFLCPLNLRQATDPGSPTANVSWVVPNVTDNSGVIASLEASNVPGDAFSIGSHTVTYTALDRDNNIGTCSFAVTVFGKLPVCFLLQSFIAVVVTNFWFGRV